MTKDNFTGWFRRFVEYCNLPEVRAKIGVDIGDNTDLLLFDDIRKIQRLIKGYIDYQYDHFHLSPNTVRNYYLAVKHFYQSNDKAINWNIKDYVGSYVNVSANIDMPTTYTYEEIHRMLDKCDERKRVVILLMASTGMRRGAIPELKYGDLKWIEQCQLYEITVYRGFTEQYVTYCSSECAYSINSYLEYRKREGEAITADSYLVRKQFDTNPTKIKKRKISDARDPPHKHKVTIADIESMIYRLIYGSGIRGHDEKKARNGDRHKNMAAHSFRKFFENKCLESGIDPFYVSVLMGHKSGIGVERHYYRPDSINGEYSLLELYAKKAMPCLTISDEERLRLKNRELEMRVKEQQEMYDRIRQDMRKEFEEKSEEREDLLRKMMDERIAKAMDEKKK